MTTPCEFENNISFACGEFQEDLRAFVNAVKKFDQIRTGSGDHEPTVGELSVLWGECLAPPGAIVFWENTSAGTVTLWICPDGDYYDVTS